VEKLPFFQSGMQQAGGVDDYELVRIESLINSMTPQERQRPDIIDESRSERIAKGAGREVSEIQDLLGKFRDMRDLMVAMGGGKIKGRWKRLKGLKKMMGGAMGGLGAMGPELGPGNPLGLPEMGPAQKKSKKTMEKRRKKSKQARQARKKGRKK
jgi:signal recognition particle subunit SRP54